MKKILLLQIVLAFQLIASSNETVVDTTLYKGYPWSKLQIFEEIIHLWGSKHEEVRDNIRKHSSWRIKDSSQRHHLDLTIFDVIDQLSLEKNKKIKQTLKSKMSSPVLLSFKPILDDLLIKAKNDKKLKRILKRLIFRPYTDEDVAIAPMRQVLRQGKFKRTFDRRRIFKYNLFAQNPDSRNHLKNALKHIDQSKFITPLLTVTKVKDLKQKQIKKILKSYYKDLKKLLESEVNSVETQIYGQFKKRIKVKAKKDHIKFTFKPFKNMPKLDSKRAEEFYKNLTCDPQKDQNIIHPNTPEDIEFFTQMDLLKRLNNTYRKAIFLTNQIYSSPYKDLYIEHLALKTTQQHLLKMDIDTFKVIESNIGTVSLLEPHYVASNLDFVKESVRETSSYILRDDNVDRAYMLLKRFIRSNRKAIEEKIQVPKKLNKENVFTLYPELEKLYPGAPWLRKAEFIGAMGNPINIDVRGFSRFVNKGLYAISTLTKIENLAQTAVTVGGGFLVGSPVISSLIGGVVQDIIYAKRYDHPVGKYLAQNTPKSLINILSTTSGFLPGNFANAFFIGFAKGSADAVLTGRPIAATGLMRAFTSTLGLALPPEIANPVIKGMNKNFENALLEFATNALRAGAEGYFVALFTDGDTKDGVIKGVLIATAKTTFDILVRGFKYDPSGLITEENIEDYLNGEMAYSFRRTGLSHNEFMSDRAYGGRLLTMDKKFFRRTIFRKDSPFRKLHDISTNMYRRSDFLALIGFTNDVSMGIGSEENIRTLVHEAVHYRQYMQFGYLRNFLHSSYNRGIFEDYIQIPGAPRVCGCMSLHF